MARRGLFLSLCILFAGSSLYSPRLFADVGHAVGAQQAEAAARHRPIAPEGPKSSEIDKREKLLNEWVLQEERNYERAPQKLREEKARYAVTLTIARRDLDRGGLGMNNEHAKAIAMRIALDPKGLHYFAQFWQYYREAMEVFHNYRQALDEAAKKIRL